MRRGNWWLRKMESLGVWCLCYVPPQESSLSGTSKGGHPLTSAKHPHVECAISSLGGRSLGRQLGPPTLNWVGSLESRRACGHYEG